MQSEPADQTILELIYHVLNLYYEAQTVFIYLY